MLEETMGTEKKAIPSLGECVHINILLDVLSLFLERRRKQKKRNYQSIIHFLFFYFSFPFCSHTISSITASRSVTTSKFSSK